MEIPSIKSTVKDWSCYIMEDFEKILQCLSTWVANWGLILLRHGRFRKNFELPE